MHWVALEFICYGQEMINYIIVLTLYYCCCKSFLWRSCTLLCVQCSSVFTRSSWSVMAVKKFWNILRGGGAVKKCWCPDWQIFLIQQYKFHRSTEIEINLFLWYSMNCYMSRLEQPHRNQYFVLVWDQLLSLNRGDQVSIYLFFNFKKSFFN